MNDLGMLVEHGFEADPLSIGRPRRVEIEIDVVLAAHRIGRRLGGGSVRQEFVTLALIRRRAAAAAGAATAAGPARATGAAAGASRTAHPQPELERSLVFGPEAFAAAAASGAPCRGCACSPTGGPRDFGSSPPVAESLPTLPVPSARRSTAGPHGSSDICVARLAPPRRAMG